MIKCLVALILVVAFSASAFSASSEKAKTKLHQRHLQSTTSEHPWRQMRDHKPGKYDDDPDWQREYWEPCNSTFYSYITWTCTW